MFKRIAQHLERRDDESGQILVIVGVSLVAIVAMVGLVLDGGSAFTQRRSQQNASDLAAMAGANTYLMTNDTTAATNAARTVSAENGWTHGNDGTNVSVSYDMSNGVAVTVQVDAVHHNSFGAIVGISTMNVATSATAISGYPDTAEGPAPMIFSTDVFGPDGKPLAQYSDPNNPFGFGETNNDAPETPGDFAWTNYGTGNVNTEEVSQLIGGELVITKTIDFGEYIGQHNNGNHTALYDDIKECTEKPTINKCLSDSDVPIPVVDHNGNFMGWATFHVTSADKGQKKVYGYFKNTFNNQRLSVGGCRLNVDCPRNLGSPVLQLID